MRTQQHTAVKISRSAPRGILPKYEPNSHEQTVGKGQLNSFHQKMSKTLDSVKVRKMSAISVENFRSRRRKIEEELTLPSPGIGLTFNMMNISVQWKFHQYIFTALIHRS